MRRIHPFVCAVVGAQLFLSTGCVGSASDSDAKTRAQVVLPVCPEGVPPWRISGKCILQDK